MSDNVVSLSGRRLVGEGIEISPDDVLDGARGNLTEVVVIGVGTDGSLYAASSKGQPEAMALMDLAKRWMLNQIAAGRGWD